MKINNYYIGGRMNIDLTRSDIEQIQQLIRQRKADIFGWAKKYDAGYLSKDSEREIGMLDELYDRLIKVEK